MDTTSILDMLVQSIERDAFPYFYAKAEYRQNQDYAARHFQWLREHLGKEARGHLEKAWDAETYIDAFEREALIRTALAVGIRLALSC